MSRSKKKSMISQICPPVILPVLRSMRTMARKVLVRQRESGKSADGSAQDLEMYWESSMADILETWGEDNAWHEIKFFMANCEGKILDIACGTGKTMEILRPFKKLEITGCDISDYLIHKAIERGIISEKLIVCDATHTGFSDNFFDNGYSIGSLEHFTEGGIQQVFAECHRIVKGTSFHMIPVSRSGRDEGWLKTYQSYYNNTVEWWLKKCYSVYNQVEVLDSLWEDDISTGKWLVCKKR